MTNFSSYSNLVYKIIGSAMTVHSNLGAGLLEPIYNEALTIELAEQGIEAESEKYLECYYKNHLLQKSYRMDIVGDVILELKSVQKIIPAHRSQLFNYLRLTRKPVGVLINFGSESLQGERYGFDEKSNTCFLLDRYMKPINISEDQEIEWYEDPYSDLK